jgi:hypothetical protein
MPVSAFLALNNIAGDSTFHRYPMATQDRLKGSLPMHKIAMHVRVSASHLVNRQQGFLWVHLSVRAHLPPAADLNRRSLIA